jgi:hypothetical protein
MTETTRIEEVPGTTPTTDEVKSAVVIDFMEALRKVSGGKWFKDNEMTLKETLERSLASLPVAVADGGDESVDEDLIPSETEKALRAQLSETLEAHSTLDAEYQLTYKVLIDLAALTCGGLENLKDAAPLTVEKLYFMVSSVLKGNGPTIDSSGFNSLEWVRERKKNLVMVGQGPLASGRYEGEHGLLVQLEQAILRSRPPAQSWRS